MKLKSIPLIILACLVFIYAAIHIIAVKKLNGWIDQEDHISAENANLNLLIGNLKLEGVQLTDRMYTTDNSRIESIEVRGFSLINYLLNDEIDVNEIALHNAQLFLKKFKTNDSNIKTSRSFNLTNITIDSSELNYQTEEFNLQINQCSGSIIDVTNVDKLQFEDIELSLNNLVFSPKGGAHNFKTTHVDLNTSDNHFEVSNFIIQPKCGVDEWINCQPDKKSRSTYSVDKIIGKLDPDSNTSGIILKELEISDGLLEILSYQEMEQDDEPKVFFMEQFDRLDVPVDIQVIEVKNHDIQVLLKAEKVDTIGFKEVYSTITNVTNKPDKIKENNSIQAKTVSKFMGTELSVDFEFKIKDSLNSYAFKLDLNPMPFTKLNKALNYNTSFVIEEGLLQQLKCEVEGTSVASNGLCNIAYKDLYVTLEDKSGQKRNFLTKAINMFVKDGTSKNQSVNPRVYEDSLEREENTDFFFQSYTIILQMIRDAMLRA